MGNAAGFGAFLADGRLAGRQPVVQLRFISVNRAMLGILPAVDGQAFCFVALDGADVPAQVFGNVLGSNGSIVPILQEQIRTSGELTITHPDAHRFFMTIHEAVSLVLQASSIGEHGEILVLDMGRALRIVDLAKTLVRLSGKSEKEMRIRFSGLRPGEKLCEELFHVHESVALTAHPKIRIARAPVGNWSALEAQLRELRLAMEIGSDRDISSALFSIVTAHAPQNPAASVFMTAEETEPALLHRTARA